MQLTLRSLQQWFAAGVMTPESEVAPRGEAQASALLRAGPRLGALDRFEIYRRAYHARLVECLADDYPVLRHALGEAAFDFLCRAYIERHPSTDPNLNGFGKAMAQFCASHAPEPFAHRSFAIELARLEWAIVEVIHAEGVDPLTTGRLSAVAPESWAQARLVVTPALRLLRSSFPVNAYYQAVRAGGVERSAGGADEVAHPRVPSADPSAVVVYRNGATIWRMDLEDAAFDLLQALASGKSLGSALDETAGGLDGVGEEAAAQRVMGWFRDWVSSGLFSDVQAG